MSDKALEQKVRDALQNVSLPGGAPLATYAGLSDIIVTTNAVAFAITIAPGLEASFAAVKEAAEEEIGKGRWRQKGDDLHHIGSPAGPKSTKYRTATTARTTAKRTGEGREKHHRHRFGQRRGRQIDDICQLCFGAAGARAKK